MTASSRPRDAAESTRNRLLDREFWRARWDSPFFRGALLFAAVLLAYLPAIRCGYVWDDDVYVTQNPLLAAPDGLWRIWFTFDSPSQYFPLVYTTMRFEYGLWGLAPMGYHCVNILLHAANALLLWRVLERLKAPGAWFAAALFALHPVQVESVAWVTELKNVQMGFFFMLAVLAWLAFDRPRRAWGYYFLSLVCYALSLFSKTTACTMPLALLLICWWRGERIGWRRLAEIVPYGAMGLGMGLLTVWWERYHQGTQGTAFAMGLAQRLVIAGRGVWFYAYKLLWPAKLTFSYPLWRLTAADPAAWLWLIALCALAAALFLARPRLGRGPIVAVAFFVGTLGPILGILMLYTFRYSFVADHYQYLACIGPMALAAGGAALLLEKCPRLRVPIGAAGAALLLTLAALTWTQCHVYRNEETVWADTIEKNPGSLMAHFNLANELSRDGRFSQSLAQYDEAVRIDPTFLGARCNRGDVLCHVGRFPAALSDYQTAERIDPANALIENSYGTMLMRLRRPADAAPHFAIAARLEPGSALAEKNLADALSLASDFAGALPHYQEVERLLPTAPQSHMLVARTDARLHDQPEAIREAREALRLASGSGNAADQRLVAACQEALSVYETPGDGRTLR
jgi:tetratricopeptide (TPR) repeat protein